MMDDGLMTPEAYASFGKVIDTLGHGGVHVQRGAAHVVMSVRKILAKFGDPPGRITGFEVRVQVGPGGKYGVRIYDMEIQQGEKLFRIEMKAWDPTKFNEYMKTSLTGLGRVSDKTDVVPNQMSKDLIDSLNKVGLRLDGDKIAPLQQGALDKVDVRWILDGRTTANAQTIAKEVIDILKGDRALAKGLLKRVNGFEGVEKVTDDLIDEFLDGDQLKGIIEKIFEFSSV